MDHLTALCQRFLIDEPYRLLPNDDLWARVRDGSDEAAFRVFLERVGTRIYLVGRAALGDGAADEAFQETFCALLRHRAKLPTYQAAVAWLYVTARSQVRLIRRRNWRWRLRDRRRAVPADAAAPNGEGVEPDSQQLVHAALGELPARQRRVIELVYLEGMTHAEAADALGWPRGTVNKYVQRGLERLRRGMARQGVTAAVGVGVVEAALRADAAPLPATRLTALAAGAWEQAAQGSRAWVGLSWAAAVLTVGAGLAVGGVALWPRGPAPAPAAAERETLQAKNLRILHAEVLPRVVAELDRVLPDDRPWAVVDAVAVGSDVRVEFRSGRTPPGGAPRRLRMSYCVQMRRFWAGHHDPVDGSWPTGDPEQPGTLRVPVPFAPGEILPLPLVHRNRWDDVIRAFAALPVDERAEGELVRYLFGPTGTRAGEFTLTVEARAVAANSTALYLCAGNGTYTRPAGGGWQYWGMTLGWGMSVDEERLYCYRDQAVWAYRLDAPASPLLKVCDSPERLWLRALAVESGTFAAAPMDDRRREVWVRRGSTASWERITAPGYVLAVAIGGGELFAMTADRLYRRPIDRPDAAWADAGATPKDTLTLFLWGDRLVHVPRTGGTVRARSRTAPPTAAWEPIGRLYHNDITRSSNPRSN